MARPRAPKGGGGDRRGRSPGGRPAKSPGPHRPRVSRRRRQGLLVTPLAEAPAPAASGRRVRLNRFLAMAGLCSRRAAEELIAQGRIEVNGERTAELGTTVDPQVDDVRFDGEPVRQEKAVHVLLNKPKGVVCTTARHEQKTRVIDLMPRVRGRLFTVGRLDLDSEGLILVTNDGDFAQRLTHPRHGVPKVYSVLVRGRVGPEQVQKARGGVWLAEGPTGGMQIRVERAGKERSHLKVTLREGRNREIRRVFAKLGLPVLELKRIRIGELSLHGLRPGEWRFLSPDEVRDLRTAGRRADGARAAAERPDGKRRSRGGRSRGGSA